MTLTPLTFCGIIIKVSDGQFENSGAILSFTVTVKEQVSEFPSLSIAT